MEYAHDEPLATLSGPRGASLGNARGQINVEVAPSGNVAVIVNGRPITWGGEWTGNTSVLYLTPAQAVEVGQALIAKGGQS